MIDRHSAKQAFTDLVDNVADYMEYDHIASHNASDPIVMPAKLASQVLITDALTKIYRNDHDPLKTHEYYFEGDNVVVTKDSLISLTIVTDEAMWKWDCTSKRWWIAGIDPDFYYKLRDGAET